MSTNDEWRKLDAAAPGMERVLEQAGFSNEWPRLAELRALVLPFSESAIEPDSAYGWIVRKGRRP